MNNLTYENISIQPDSQVIHGVKPLKGIVKQLIAFNAIVIVITTILIILGKKIKNKTLVIIGVTLMSSLCGLSLFYILLFVFYH